MVQPAVEPADAVSVAAVVGPGIEGVAVNYRMPVPIAVGVVPKMPQTMVPVGVVPVPVAVVVPNWSPMMAVANPQVETWRADDDSELVCLGALGPCRTEQGKH